MKPILIQHGEKIALTLIVLLCALSIKGVIDDPKTQPNKESTPDAITALLKKIDKRSADLAPRPKKPIDYTGAIGINLGTNVESAQTMQWLFARPDIIIGDNAQEAHVFTAYEVYAPTIAVTDEVGSISIEVMVHSRENGRSGASSRSVVNGPSWLEEARATAEGTQNSASWLGVHVEYRVSEGEWTPLTTSGLTKNGYFFFHDGNIEVPSFILSGVQGEQRYEFRSHLLVKATGITEQGPPLLGNEIIVHDGKCIHPDRSGWGSLHGRVDGRLLPMSIPPASVQLAATEKVYMSAASKVAIIEKTEADVIIALKSARVLVGQSAQARIVMRKKVRNALGTVLGWTKQVEFKGVAIGEVIGYSKKEYRGIKPGNVVVDVAGTPREVNFVTDWKIKEIKMDSTRILYYEVKKVSGAGGVVKLELKPKVFPSYQTITIVNSNGDEVILPKLKALSVQERLLPFVYPQLPNNSTKYSEIEEFKNGNPQEFANPTMLPEGPVIHPSEDLVNYDPQASTNIPFYVFADDRYVYYDHLARKLRAAAIVRPEPVGPEGHEYGSEGVEEDPPEGVEHRE